MNTADNPAEREQPNHNSEDKILRRANHIYFSDRDEPFKSRITRTQCQAVIEAWIREVMPWWFEDEA